MLTTSYLELYEALQHHPHCTSLTQGKAKGGYGQFDMIYPLLDSMKGARCTPFHRLSPTSDPISDILRTKILPGMKHYTINERGHYGMRLSPSLFSPLTPWPYLDYLEILHSPIDAMGNWYFD